MSASLSSQFPGKSIDIKFFESKINSVEEARNFVRFYNTKVSEAVKELFANQAIDKSPLDRLHTEITDANAAGKSPGKKAKNDFIRSINDVRLRTVQWLSNPNAPVPVKISDAAELIGVAGGGKNAPQPAPAPAPAPKAKEAPAPVHLPAPVAAKTYSIWRTCFNLFAVVATIALGAYAFTKYVRPRM